MIFFSSRSPSGPETGYLTQQKGWPEAAAHKISFGLRKAIFEIESTGLEGTSYPVIITLGAQARIADAWRRSAELSTSELMELLNSQAQPEFEAAANIIANQGKTILRRFALTGAVATTLSEPELRFAAEKLGPAAERFELDSPGELELDHAVPIVEVPALIIGKGLDGAGQTVAVLDGEIWDHPSVRGRVQRKAAFSKYDWSVGTGDAGEDFARNHATAVASIIAGNGDTINQKTLYVGVAPKATLWNYKIAPSTTRGSDVAAALEAAFLDGVRIVNLSWGKSDVTLDGSSIWSRTIDAMFERGTLVFKSAGNVGPQPGTITAPADALNVISVGATTRDGVTLHERSSRGPTVDGREKPEILAPGGGMYAGNTDGGYSPTVSPGTSFAAPVAAGLAALLWQGFPAATAHQIRAAILETRREVGIPGLISADLAFAYLERLILL